jgi:hypothetical protein
MGILARLGFRGREMSTPATPASGERALYAKTTGWYEKDSAGVERLLTHAIEAYVFSVVGTVTVATGKSRIYLEGNYTVETIAAAVNTAPTGAALTCDINKNGTTIFTTPGNRPSIAVSTFYDGNNVPDITTYAPGDYLSVDVDQIGSTVAGADLTVTVRLRRN